MSRALLREPDEAGESRADSEAAAEGVVGEARRAVDDRRRGDDAEPAAAVVEDAAGRELGLAIDGDPEPGEVAAIAAAVCEAVATDGGREVETDRSAEPGDRWTFAGRYAMTTGRRVRCPGGDCSDGWRWAARADGGW